MVEEDDDDEKTENEAGKETIMKNVCIIILDERKCRKIFCFKRIKLMDGKKKNVQITWFLYKNANYYFVCPEYYRKYKKNIIRRKKK